MAKILFFSALALFSLIMLVRRVTNETRSRAKAREMEVRCTKCGFEGQPSGYTGAFARPVIACPKCKAEALEPLSREEDPQDPSES